VCCTIQRPAKSIYFSHASATDTLTLLIKVSATVAVYKGHRRTLFFLPGNISLFIMCVRIIRNNSLVGERARAEVWTPAPEGITLYCTWRPSAMTNLENACTIGDTVSHQMRKPVLGALLPDPIFLQRTAPYSLTSKFLSTLLAWFQIQKSKSMILWQMISLLMQRRAVLMALVFKCHNWKCKI